ncbi:putative disease resistance protein [Salvia divinorum]|uniref:Disease resistance protein n=1 Tax=Salvia divinorum TaxID=28513 RepID=A0ABD1HHI1_SALDI
MNGIMNWNKIGDCGVSIEGSCDLTSERMLEKALTCPNLYELGTSIKLGKALAMGILGKLPWLIKLRLYDESFVGEEMRCPANSFPRLKELALRGLPKSREWRVEAGAMPFLSELMIRECSCLEMVPEGLSRISTLQRLDFHKVRHVPSIIIKD